MKTFSSRSCRFGFCAVLALAVAAAVAPARAAQPLSDADMKFMTIYEQIQKGLVTNNLNVAKDAAHALANSEGDPIKNAKDIKEARSAFATLSQHAEKIVAGNPQYHVFNCPMVNKDWVQSTTTVANPYLGADMLTCGVEKKK